MRGDNNMMRNYMRKIAIVISLFSLFTIVNFQRVHAQVVGTEPQVVKWLSASALRSWFSNFGSEIEYGRRDRATYQNVDQIDGLCWPNEYSIRMKGIKVGKSLWIGTTDFADPISNTTYPYKVVCMGGRMIVSGTEVFSDELSLIGTLLHPNVYVDDARASARDYDDALDKVDNNQVADRVMMNRFHTSIGVSVTRKVLAFSQQYNDNYYIYEYTFKNTGIIDGSGQQKLDKTLTGVIFYMQHRLAYSGMSVSATGAYFWLSGGNWGRNTINDVMRKDGPTPGEFRADFSYWGPMSTTAFGSPSADIGGPGPNATAVTQLAATEFGGTVVLHADKSSTDPTDDITQPTTTKYVGSDNPVDLQPSQYNENLMTQKYTIYLTGGHYAQTQADQVGKDANGWPTNYANIWGTDAGGYKSTQGFGPYTLAPGDSIRIVVAECVAGISWNNACEVAKNWFANDPSKFVLPSGYAAKKGYTTTTDKNEYKNAWVFSGKDSLFQTFRRAIANYNSNYAIPQPPPPPDLFQVNSGGDRIKIKWSNSAESSPHFDGYRLFRSEGKTDTTYGDPVFECGKSTGNLVNSYDDQSAKRGSNYYYYIQSKDDGSTNPGDPSLNIPAHEPLVSSRYLTMTMNPAYLTRPAGVALTNVNKIATYIGNDTTTDFLLPKTVADSTGTVVRGLSVTVDGVRQIPALYKIMVNTSRITYTINNVTKLRPDTLRFVKAPLGTIEVTLIAPVNPRVSMIIIGDSIHTKFGLPEFVVDSKGNKIYDVKVSDTSGVISSALYTIVADTIIFTQAYTRRDTLTVLLTSQVQRNYLLSAIRVVPNPYNIKARNIQYGQNDPTSIDKLGFYNLPPVCTIKIYTEVGDLIATIDHNNGSGDDYWYSLTSSRQVVVSGLYIAYIEVTEDSQNYRKGDNIFKKFIIIR